MIFYLGYWVIAGSSPWMATADSFDAEPAAFEDPVFQDGFDHILAACRRISAGRWRKRRDEDAVEINRQQKRFTNNYFPFILFSALHTAFSMTA